MSDTERSKVYIVGRQSGGGPERAIHTDSECPVLDLANSVFEKDRSVFPDDKPVCTTCSGGIARPETHDTSHYNALVAAAEADSE
ncbi:hypothetical protein NDI85_19850 [Halomicroarcula sp. S1AR25-4]|uniref:hypothetical protein n=1 Tax=Haloarcula sp. S1AR25-4 TaxID=2950538 RepID=UPI002875F218|nr:hypothetical protein [Halomicroarcula sp. S1AR25-4]MDS0280042.1 hypothetical protein [Halomicroarcula sp. S1AR25-4]